MPKEPPKKDRVKNPPRNPGSRAAWIVGALLLAGIGLAAASLAYQNPQRGRTAAAGQTATAPAAAGAQPASDQPLPKNELNAERAYGYLKDVCAIGRRFSGSPGMQQQQELVKKHFESLGGKVTMQEFQGKHPQTGQMVPMANMIVTWHPDRKQRILLCAHYDTRPFPDQDPDPVKQSQGVFIGANDGASGVAVMMELAHMMPKLESRYGIDFVLFDGEELVFGKEGEYFLGSKYFAREYIRVPPEHKYKWGVLMDMVGGTNLQLYQEVHSVTWPDTRPLVAQIWGMAQRLKVQEFIALRKHEVLDDHLALRNTARIPTCDIIDFDYPAWHTADDVPQNCSGASLAKVGWVLSEWFKRAE